jgi:hypothetical protein
MGHIVLLHHRYDSFRTRRGLKRYFRYMMGDVLEILRRRGHRVSVTGRPDRVPAGDLLIMHVDASVVPEEYLSVAASFPVTINGGVRDITKRAISELLIGPEDGWDGPVFVKSNLNCCGRPEARHNRKALFRGRPRPNPGLRVLSDYGVYPSLAQVPASCRSDAGIVIEKFMPEDHPQGFAARTYIFCGATERCSVHVSASPVVKGHGVVSSTPVEVPGEIREIRRRLGFDYGKFDFVMRDGRPILLDANKTLGVVRANGPLADRIRKANDAIADGVEGFLAA